MVTYSQIGNLNYIPGCSVTYVAFTCLLHLMCLLPTLFVLGLLLSTHNKTTVILEQYG